MKVLLLLVRGYVALVATVGFIFGQFFSATFSIGATLAGVFGAIAAGLIATKENPTRNRLVFAVCAVAIAGVGVDAYHYYKFLDIPGNYYAWGLIGPFVAGLAFIAMSCAKATGSQ